MLINELLTLEDELVRYSTELVEESERKAVDSILFMIDSDLRKKGHRN